MLRSIDEKHKHILSQESSHRHHLATFGKVHLATFGILLRLELVFDQISKLRTQSIFKNIKMTAHVEEIAHNLKTLYSESAPSFPGIQENSENRKGSVRSAFLMKLQVCITFASIRLYHLYFLVTS